jgi:hypothetical protein
MVGDRLFALNDAASVLQVVECGACRHAWAEAWQTGKSFDAEYRFTRGSLDFGAKSAATFSR